MFALSLAVDEAVESGAAVDFLKFVSHIQSL
jgi:hypothetical protein